MAERLEDSSGLVSERDLFGGDPSLLRGPLQEGMAALYELFERGPEIGSLLDPGSLGGTLFRADFKSLRKLLEGAIKGERRISGRDERTIAAAGMARAAELLQGHYTLVVTNVPFLSRQRQDPAIASWLAEHHEDAKGDIANVFVSRIFGWLGTGGTQAIVTPQNWLFLKTYRKLRERLLKGRVWNLTGRLGTKAFDTPMWDFNVLLNILSAGRPSPDREMAGVDVSSAWGERPIRAAEKAELLRGCAEVVMSRQGEQVGNPESAVLMRPLGDQVLLQRYCEGLNGTTTGDFARYGRTHWEVSLRSNDWIFQQSTVKSGVDFGGRENALHWKDGEDGLQTSDGATIRGKMIWNRNGVAVSQIGALPATRYTGEHFDNNVSALGPLPPDILPAVWCFCSSPDYAAAVREIDQTLKVTNATLVKVPFDLDHWKKVAAEKYPNGLPEPYSDDPTQWIFHGDPCGSVIWDEETKRTASGPLRIDGAVLQVAVARLLGYRWPAERDPNMRLAPEQREVVEYCREFARFADADGIVCLSAARGELNAADRLRNLLAAAYDDEWSGSTERALLAATGPKPPNKLENWLRDHFFQEHCKLFHNRPFIWHIWDGRKDGFHALVNYHRLAGPDGEGRRTLESLTYAYLNEWIERQRAEKQEETPGAEGRLEAALDLRQQLQRILNGEPPCDIFVRWRPLHGQAIGWDPDINDGVRLNIRPFMRAELRKGGRAGAGILRWKPNIKWGKDRGKEPEEPRPREDFPWFWGCPGTGSKDARTDFRAPLDATFDGNRWNDLHYTRAVKKAARRGAP